jgi:hypothetical protein
MSFRGHVIYRKRDLAISGALPNAGRSQNARRLRPERREDAPGASKGKLTGAPNRRAVFERPSYVTRWRRTGWQESNYRISNDAERLLNSLRRPTDVQIRRLDDFDMQRFESRRPG